MSEEHTKKKNKKVKLKESKGALSKKNAEFVIRKPWTIILLTVFLLGGLASFVPPIQYTYDLYKS